MTNRIHIIGRKNSGKTTLIVELVQQLTARGLRVGTIKHTHHHHELDTPGKDSHRHRTAGAAMVGIMAPEMNAIFWPEADSQGDRYERMLAMYAGCDIVLVEGHATGLGTKVEVWREATNTEPIARSDDSVVAIISDDQPDVVTPVWRRADVSSLAERILQLSPVEGKSNRAD